MVKRPPVRKTVKKKAVKKKTAVKKRVPVKKKAIAKKKRPAKKFHPLMLDDQRFDMDKVMDLICDELATSSLGLGTILVNLRKEHGKFPGYSGVMKWLDDENNAGLVEKYARAKAHQGEFLADEITEIADDGRNDWMEDYDKDGQLLGYKLNGEHIQRSKLRVDSRRWLASKLAAKKYGEKLELNGPGGGPIKHAATIEFLPVAEDED